jgi:hypothetical protein
MALVVVAAIDLSDILSSLEVELGRTGIAQRQQAWLGDTPTGLRRWKILNPFLARQVVANAIAAADGLDELSALTAEAKQSRSPLSYYLGTMSPSALCHLLETLEAMP